MGPESWDASFTDARLPQPQVLWPVGPASSEENDEPVVLGAKWGSQTPRSCFSDSDKAQSKLAELPASPTPANPFTRPSEMLWPMAGYPVTYPL